MRSSLENLAMAPTPSDLHSGPESVAVYGLSSEGYQIASKLASKGMRVSIIDETLGTTMILRPEIASDYRDLKLLLSEEILWEMKPMRDALTEAKVVFFAPKLRRRDEDALSEAKTRLMDISKRLSAGVLFVFCLPLGIGGAREIIDRIEHASGLTLGTDLFFAYTPLEFGRAVLLGSESQLSGFTSVIDAAGFSMEIYSLLKAELVHAQRVVSRFSNLASFFESARRLTVSGSESPREYKQIYAEDLSAFWFDLRLVIDSLEPGDPLLYLGSGSQKSIESYPRFLVDRIRELVRQRDLKAARLRIILFTDMDSYEMRGDKMHMANDLVNRLRDFFGDIEYMNIMKENFTLPTGTEKINLMVFLSGSSEQRMTQLYEEQIAMTKTHMIRANLPVEYVT